jgi:hypothetical protein
VCGRVGGRAAGPSPGRPSLGLVTVGPVWAGAPPPTVPACRLESPTAPTMHAGRGQGGRRACATAPVPATYITTLNVPVRHAWNRPSWTTRVTGVGLRVSTWLRRGAGEGGGVTGLAYVCGAILTGPTREQARPGEYKFTTWRAPLHPGAPWATHAAGRCTASPERPRPEPTPAAQRTHLGSTACRPGWPTSTATLPSLSRHRGRAHGG